MSPGLVQTGSHLPGKQLMRWPRHVFFWCLQSFGGLVPVAVASCSSHVAAPSWLQARVSCIFKQPFVKRVKSVACFWAPTLTTTSSQLIAVCACVCVCFPELSRTFNQPKLRLHASHKAFPAQRQRHKLQKRLRPRKRWRCRWRLFTCSQVKGKYAKFSFFFPTLYPAVTAQKRYINSCQTLRAS